MMNKIGFNEISTKVEETQKNPWLTHYLKEATIFGKNTFLPIDFGHAKNDNTLVVGSSGTGKTYSFVEPNVLQGNANYIIADSKGTILSDLGASLKAMGYDIQVLNLLDLKHSNTYNPFNYFKSEFDVTRFAEQLVTTDTAGETNRQNDNGPCWDKAATTLISAIIFFVQEFLPTKEQNLAAVVKIFDLIDQDSENLDQILLSLGLKNTNYIVNGLEVDKSIGTLLFENARTQKPHCLAVKYWDKVKGASKADSTWGGITAEVGAALAQFSLGEVQDLMATNQIEFQKLLQPKTAFFIIYDDGNVTKNFISNSFYTQLFSYLYDEAYQCEDQKLPVKIRFFLDDFKNITIPHFADYLATTRSRNISVCMMLQDESQLRAKYGNEAPSIIGNCSVYLLTGTIDLGMARDASCRFELTPQEIRRLGEDNFLVDISGYVTKTSRYDYQTHPNYVSQKIKLNNLPTTPSVESIMKWDKLGELLIPPTEAKTELEPEPYWQKAQRLVDLASQISDTSSKNEKRLAAVKKMKRELYQCTKDKELDDLTKIYRDSRPNTTVNVGYDNKKVSEFLQKFHQKYPRP